LRKIVIISFIVVLSAGCSVSRRQSRTKTSGNENPNVFNLYESIVNQNITARSFYIEKAEFRIRSEEGEKSGIGTVKFLMPDKFLITIKTKAGIEIARILLTGDTIMANDRFNKRLYYGSTSYLKEKYGLTTSLLPIVLGDYVNDEKLDSSRIECVDGKVNIDGIVRNVRIKYQLDCHNGKSVLTQPKDLMDENVLRIKYSDFFKANNIYTPGEIEITEGQGKSIIEIRIQKIISPWEGSIEFIPGNKYEIIHLL
jgi:hypothetical protein